MNKGSAIVPLRKQAGIADVPARLRRLAEKQRFAVLATLSPEGPQLSLVAFAVTEDLGVVCFATPRNTRKYRNILADGRSALLLDTRGKASMGLMEAKAISLNGLARILRPGKRRSELEALLLARHPELGDFLSAPGTALVALEVERGSHVEAFQKVSDRDQWGEDIGGRKRRKGAGK
jgi:hypothetical protein